MENNKKEDKTDKKILERIKSGDIKMKSKFYFLAKTIILASVVIVLFLLTIYLISFILYFTKSRGIWFSPVFGISGFKILFGGLPWLIILLALILIFAVITFAEKFSVIYKRPILYSLMVFVVLATFVATFVENTSLHHYMIYDKSMPHNFYYGSILEMTDSGFFMKDINNDIIEVTVKNKAPLMFCEELLEGNHVMIMGEKNGSNVSAEKIKKISE